MTKYFNKNKESLQQYINRISTIESNSVVSMAIVTAVSAIGIVALLATLVDAYTHLPNQHMKMNSIVVGICLLIVVFIVSMLKLVKADSETSVIQVTPYNERNISHCYMLTDVDYVFDKKANTVTLYDNHSGYELRKYDYILIDSERTHQGYDIPVTFYDYETGNMIVGASYEYMLEHYAMETLTDKSKLLLKDMTITVPTSEKEFVTERCLTPHLVVYLHKRKVVESDEKTV